MKSVLSPRELALAIGVSESSLKRWADEGLISVFRTAGGHRRIALPEAIRFIRDRKANILRPDILGLVELNQLTLEQWSGRSGEDELYRAMEAGDAVQTRGLILSHYLAGRSLPELCDGPIRAAMHRLGELWLTQDGGIFIEHRATDLCLAAVNHLRQLMDPQPATAPLAIGGGLSGDPYLLPSLLASLVLSDSGFREMNLGPDTPVEVLQQAAHRLRPALVWVSISSLDHVSVPGRRRELEQLAESLLGIKVPVVVGGRMVEPLEPLRQANLHVIRSMSEFSGFARGLLTPRDGGA